MFLNATLTRWPADNINKEKSVNMNSIYNYLDYREFLKDRLAHMKENVPCFSYRFFNIKAGIKSSGHLKLIVDGKRNLGKKGMYNICRGLGLSEKEARFFETLIDFNQADNHEEKEHFYKKLTKSYPAKHAKNIEAKQYKMFSHWYYVAILELVRVSSFSSSPEWISKKLKPAVNVTDVNCALADLAELGLIIKNSNGGFSRTEKMIGTPEEVESIALTSFHEQMTGLAVEALKKDEVHEKEFSTLTIALPREKIQTLKNKMQEFKKEIHSILEADGNESSTDVVHINLQLFKLTNGDTNETH